MTAILDITAANGVPRFRVVLYEPGETGPYPAARDDERPMVEVYDRRYPHTEHGQFTGGRYFVETLAGSTHGAGISLDGGVDDWTLDGPSYALVRAWLRSHYPEVMA